MIRSNIGTAGVAPDERNATNTAIAPPTSGPATVGGQPDVVSQPQAGQPLDTLALKRELGELCKQTFEREFSKKSASEFDKCYLGQQIGAHLHAIDAMKVAHNHASNDLRKVLDEGIQTAQQHLQHAKELAKKLEGQSSGSSTGDSSR